jgi:hypothetical protein
MYLETAPTAKGGDSLKPEAAGLKTRRYSNVVDDAAQQKGVVQADDPFCCAVLKTAAI